MQHPVLRLHPRLRILLLVLLWAAVLYLGYQLLEEGKRLYTPEACLGIVSLELPVTAGKAVAIIQSWEVKGVLGVARGNIQLDFLFLLLYPLAFSVFLAMASRWNSVGWHRAYRDMAWYVLLMTPLDAGENLLMLWMLDQSPTTLTATATTLLAASKFLLFVSALCLLLRALLRPSLLKLLGRKLGET